MRLVEAGRIELSRGRLSRCPSGLRAFGPLGLQARHAWPALIEAGVFVLRGCVEVAMVKARIDAHVGVIAGERGVQPRPVRAVVELLDARLTPG